MTQLPHTRPVLIGCSTAVGLATLAVFAAIALVAFLDSGADSGKVVLERAAAYAPGSAEFVGSRGFYLVRVKSGDFYALDNFDAANRASTGRRCPVAPVLSPEPGLAGLLDSYRSRISPQAGGATLLFREACNGAVYDAAGVRLDAEGPSLDRYPVAIRNDGRVVVDVSSRHCTEREGRDSLSAITCP
jgi:hypothetical protein